MSLIKREKGFTLIELMIVVAIIGILAAVAIPKFADLVTKSKEASVKGNLGTVRSALSIYYGDNDGNYPGTANGDMFSALTNANKYLPGAAGIQSLGKFEIPRAGNGNLNAGHSTALFLNASGPTSVTIGAAPVESVVGPLYYVNAVNQAGDLYIACGHQDTKGSMWTGY